MPISREKLKEQGWKVVGLPPGNDGEILAKGERRIIWDAVTMEIVEGSLDEKEEA